MCRSSPNVELHPMTEVACEVFIVPCHAFYVFLFLDLFSELFAALARSLE